ncbi:MAG: DegT/DnrJ/EryC1/StrS family aminotransferase, partial [Alphaproteobacteria bacterium]
PAGACANSELAAFSFHPVKTIATGEGGAVTTRDPMFAERLRRLRSHGMSRDPERFELTDAAFDGEGRPNPWHYEMPEPGFNYRASDIHCALGVSQLGKLERFVSARTKLAAQYDRLFGGSNTHVRPIARDRSLRSGWHLYVVLIDFDAMGASRGQVMRNLAADGIGTQVHYYPVCHQPYYRRRYGIQAVPGADAYFARTLSLPLFPLMTEGDVEFVVDRLHHALAV